MYLSQYNLPIYNLNILMWFERTNQIMILSSQNLGEIWKNIPKYVYNVE